ncbi:MAG: tetratricopeptide repeat protein [SAR324 cluster bacterium]|nr:tetratricopeptide repeat protein [SAR324 cluster bacterium]
MAERGDVDQHLLEGQRLMDSKFYDRAMVEFNKALKIDSKTTMRALDNLFDAAEDTGDYEGVVSIGTNMLLNQKDNNILANKLGNAYRKMRNFGQAIKLYEHCLKFSPDDRFAPYNLAATMARIDLYDGNAVSAVLPFEQMRNPKLPDNEEGVERLKALQREILKEQEEALSPPEDEEEDWQAKLKKEAEGPAKKSKEKKKEKINIVPEEIFERLRHQISTDEHKQLMQDIAIYCLEKSYPDIAWRSLTRLAFKIPSNEYIQCFVAMAYALRGEEQIAIDKLLSLLGKNQYNRYANANLGFLYKKQNNDLLAKKYFIITYQLLEKSQDFYDMDAFKEKGEKYFRDEIYKNALKVFEVLREEQESPVVLQRLGRIYIELDEYDKAIEVYRELVGKYGEDPEVQKDLVEINTYILNLAKSLMEKHRYSRAVLMFEMSLEIKRDKNVCEDGMGAYKLLRDEEGMKKMKIMIAQINREEQEREIEVSRVDKLKRAEKFESKNIPYKAIQAYEEALRLKPDKDVVMKLISLYKRTRQHDMIEDVTERYNKAIERMQRLAKLEAEEAAASD